MINWASAHRRVRAVLKLHLYHLVIGLGSIEVQFSQIFSNYEQIHLHKTGNQKSG